MNKQEIPKNPLMILLLSVLYAIEYINPDALHYARRKIEHLVNNQGEQGVKDFLTRVFGNTTILETIQNQTEGVERKAA